VSQKQGSASRGGGGEILGERSRITDTTQLPGSNSYVGETVTKVLKHKGNSKTPKSKSVLMGGVVPRGWGALFRWTYWGGEAGEASVLSRAGKRMDVRRKNKSQIGVGARFRLDTPRGTVI